MQESVKKLAELKMKLVTATEFRPVFDFFFDHFGENDEFMQVGVPQPNDQLQQVLGVCAGQVLKKSKVVMRNLVMVYVAEKQFYHGGGMFNQMMANFFYFEDIDAGLLALADMTSPGKTVIVRYSLQMLSEPRKPSRN